MVGILSPLCAGLPTPHFTRPKVSMTDDNSDFGDLRSGLRRGRETCAQRGERRAEFVGQVANLSYATVAANGRAKASASLRPLR